MGKLHAKNPKMNKEKSKLDALMATKEISETFVMGRSMVFQYCFIRCMVMLKQPKSLLA